MAASQGDVHSNGRDTLRRTFDRAADRYDRARPVYQSLVFDDLAVLASLEAGDRILEIGCGSGQATVPLAERGYRIVALELGSRLAQIARRNLAAHSGVQVIVAPFEEWPLAVEQFDAVLAANAFHWVDPAVRITKAANALRPGGSLVTIETWRAPIAPEAVLERLRGCDQRWRPESTRAARSAEPEEESVTRADIEASGVFDEITVRRYSAITESSTAQHHELLLTFSNVLVLDVDRQSGLLKCIDEVVDRDLAGRFVERIETRLIVARKSP